MRKANDTHELTRRKFLVDTITAGVTLAGVTAADGAVPGTKGVVHNFFNVVYEGVRTDLSGSYGFEFVPQADLSIWALGRIAGSGLNASHDVTIWDVAAWEGVADVTVTPQSPVDNAGYAYQKLGNPVILHKDHVYRITSSEQVNSDPVMDISAVHDHMAVARITTGAISPDGGFAAFTYGFENKAYGLPTFFVDTTHLPPDLLKTHLMRRKPIYRDCNTGYLMNENFCQIQPYCWSQNIDAVVSGWDTDKSGGEWQFSPQGGHGFDLEWFRLSPTKPGGGVIMKHQIGRQSHGEITLEFRFSMPGLTDGVSWQLTDLDHAGVNIFTSGGSLCWQKEDGTPIKLHSYKPGTECGVLAVVNIERRTADVYIEGRLKVQAAPFCYPIKTIDFVQIEAPHLGAEGLYLSPVNIYKGYVVNDTFVTDVAGILPDTWQLDSGRVTVEEFLCQAKPDIFSLKFDGSISDTASAARHFPKIVGKVVVEFRFILPQRADGFSFNLRSDDRTAISLKTVDGNFSILASSGTAIPLAQDYLGNLWYMVKLVADMHSGKIEAFINGKAVGKDIEFTNKTDGFNSVKVESSALAWIDDIQIYQWQDFPDNYVPEPIPCPTTEPYLVGLQSCPLSSEGNSYCGWDYIYPSRKWREPYLGWYDDNSAEAVDWQIKWQVEHGISFEMICWYRPSAYAVNFPIKTPDMTGSILKGLFNARWSHYKKFAIMYTDDNGGFTNPTDFRENLVPYWIEYFFKDSRYMQIDGKPVICLYYYDHLARDLGGLDGIRSAIDFLRDEAKKAGFQDLIILTTQTSPSPTPDIMHLRKAAGFDGIYNYTWFTGDTNAQQQDNLAHRSQANAAGFDLIANIGPGWDNASWTGRNDKPGGGWCTPEQFQELAKWVRDKFMPDCPADSLSKRLLMLDNWCEFGEGHFLMPSNLHGFGYLDAIRTVFTANPPHKDLVPTTAQKRRFTILYPRDA